MKQVKCDQHIYTMQMQRTIGLNTKIFIFRLQTGFKCSINKCMEKSHITCYFYSYLNFFHLSILSLSFSPYSPWGNTSLCAPVRLAAVRSCCDVVPLTSGYSAMISFCQRGAEASHKTAASQIFFPFMNYAQSYLPAAPLPQLIC